MAFESYGLNDAAAVKLWSKKLAYAERDSLDIKSLMGEGEDSIIQEKTETSKTKGDRVRCFLRVRPTGDGKTEGETAVGNSEAVATYSDDLLINELLHSLGSDSDVTISAQRVPWNKREQCYTGLRQWWMDRKSVSFFNQVCGYTPANSSPFGTKYTGMNTVTAPSSGRHLWSASAAADEALTSDDIFTLDLIDRAVEEAKLGSNRILPVRSKGMGQDMFVMYLHPRQVTQLRTDAGANSWSEIQRARLSGGDIKDNPLLTGALGVYGNVILRTSQDVTQGVNSSSGAAVSTVRRAVLLGAQAATIGYGTAETGGEKYRWAEELTDFKRKLEVAAGTVWGLKKMVFNSTDHGTLVVSTYATAVS